MQSARSLHDTVVASLALPEACRVNQRIPKKMLAEHGGATAADRRLLTEGIEEVVWLAAVKPSKAAVPVWRDDAREYLEVAVLSVEIRTSHAQPAQRHRVTELVHRAVPYPMLLILLAPGAIELSLAHKRAAQNEPGKVVVDGEITRLMLDAEKPHPTSLLAALALDRQPHVHLMALYQGWVDCLVAAQAERVTGRFALPASLEESEARRAALRAVQRLEQEANRLRALASKETQMAKRVELNLTLHRVQVELLAVKEAL